MPYISLGLSFAISALLVPIIRILAFRFGLVAQPKEDRWHKKPTPVFGGVAMFLGFLVPVLALTGWEEIRWGLLAGALIMFLLGIYDDLRVLSPPVKMVGQIMAAVVVVFSGYRTAFFSVDILNILLTVVWLVGITNAVNFLDNMDGLAGGISMIAAAFLSFFFLRPGGLGPGDDAFAVMSMGMAGAILGFLVYNFPPASIFMGDSGSLFLGFTLAALAIARTPQASNVFTVMSVPTLLFLLPILDTTLVTLTRLMRGQSPAQGGRDHTSHRLVAFGLTERQAVLVLYLVACITGVVGAVLESIDYQLGLILLPAVVILFSLLAAYLARLKVVDVSKKPHGAISNIMLDLTYKRRVFEILLDFFLISVAYYLAYWVESDFSFLPAELSAYLQSMPILLGITYLGFFIFGVYRGVWRYFGVEDILRFLQALIVTSLVNALVFAFVFPQLRLPSVTFVLFAIFLLLGWVASRSSFKYLDQIYVRQARAKVEEEAVLIYGAGDFGEMALRWILRNPAIGYRVVGFVDDDAYKWGRSIHGVNVIGGVAQLDTLVKNHDVRGIILTSPVAELPDKVSATMQVAQAHGIWVRRLHLGFDKVE